jgi:hypothetical protein
MFEYKLGYINILSISLKEIDSSLKQNKVCLGTKKRIDFNNESIPFLDIISYYLFDTGINTLDCLVIN